jgi:hypothetical protein
LSDEQHVEDGDAQLPQLLSRSLATPLLPSTPSTTTTTTPTTSIEPGLSRSASTTSSADEVLMTPRALRAHCAGCPSPSETCCSTLLLLDLALGLRT